MTTVELAPTSATESPLMAGVLVPPLSLMSMQVTGDPAVIVTLSGLPIPAEKLASLAATSAAVPLAVAVALPVNVILGATSSMVPISPLPAVVVSVPPMVIEPLPPVRAKPPPTPATVLKVASSTPAVVRTSPPVLKEPLPLTRIPLGLLNQTTMFGVLLTIPSIIDVVVPPTTRFSTASWVVTVLE